MNDEVIEEVNLFDDNKDKAVTQEPETQDKVDDSAPKFEVPEKFQGKSFEDVVESYTNLEKEVGRKANEVGELRKLTDEILKQSLQRPVETQTVDNINEDIGVDEFLDDPKKAVDQVVSSNPRIKQIEEALEADAKAKSNQELLSRHADANDVVQTAEFQNWVMQSPSRQRRFAEAHKNFDVDLAADMLDMYKANVKLNNDEAIETRDKAAAEDLKNAATETGSPATNTKKVYRRSELIRLKIERPAQYAAMADEIRLAYAEGRVK